jgi:hypothetical protein
MACVSSTPLAGLTQLSKQPIAPEYPIIYPMTLQNRVVVLETSFESSSVRFLLPVAAQAFCRNQIKYFWRNNRITILP